MKKLFIIITASCLLFACKTPKATASATNQPAADTALQGDKMKNPVKP